ncbi:MFS transporter [Pseudomonas sp. PS01302]|uniref:MFS transporter n=1 Tax=Pseudomonas sp. PS01302 TaxID=2991438 RepID=UPI00249BC324|nr:MFS transporter [Pseudomonas sp. PS01302]
MNNKTPDAFDVGGPGWKATNGLILSKLMPLLIVAYILSFLDRTNIAFAKERLDVDLGISAAVYGVGAGLFFLSYALLEVPSNLIMSRVGPRFWMTRILITWGLLSAGMAFIQGETSFYVMRLLLGMAEAGFFPGVMLYLTYWFPRNLRARAVGYFLLGACLANVLGAPLAGLLLELDGFGGWHGWQWLFIIEGLPAVALAYLFWKKLPDRPTEAAWLDKDAAVALENKLKDEIESGTKMHGGAGLIGALKDKQVWLVIFVYFCTQISVYSVVFFMPSIVRTYWQNSNLMVGVLVSLPWLCAAVSLLVLPRFATTASRSRRMLCVALFLMAIGFLLACYFGPVAALFGFAINLSMHMLAVSIIFQFPSSRLKGAALAGGLGLVNCIGLLGGFVGPTAMGFIERSTGKSSNGLIFIACLLVVSALMALRLRQGHEDTIKEVFLDKSSALSGSKPL